MTALNEARAKQAGAIVLSVLMAMAILAIAPATSVWAGWRPATCLPDNCFCEQIRDQLVRQPANAASGAAFIGTAMLVLLAVHRGANPSGGGAMMRSSSTYPALYAVATAVIGLGTVFYHASLTFWGQTADVFGMYLIATFLVLHNLARMVKISAAQAAGLYVLGNAVLFAGLLAAPSARRYAFGLLIVIVVLLEVIARRRRLVATSPKVFVAALGTFAVGFLTWTLDITRMLCAPRSLLQGHAVWHLASALAIWLLFLYLWREADLP